MSRPDPKGVVKEYDAENITIGVLGSHSAEEVGIAAKSFGFPTLVVCQKGREELYAKHNRHLFDHVVVLDRFSDILKEDVQDRMRKLNTVFMPNRSFSVYAGYDGIENSFNVPMYGNRSILRAEERNEVKNQYWLLEKAGIRIPKKFSTPDDIDRLAIVKVQQKERKNERAFFQCGTPDEFEKKSKELLRKGVIDEAGLKKARMEEFVLGQKFNANFHGWTIKGFDDFDFVGFDERRQTNLHGILSLPAGDQLSLNVPITNEEVGHSGLTMRESQKPLVYEAAEKFLKACKREFPPGMIGMFSLQGALAYDNNRLEFFVFDVSPRIPGAPAVGPTSPEMRRLTLKYRNQLKSFCMDRIEAPLDLSMLEIRQAVSDDRLGEIVT